jgi:hypothetical protein
MTKSIKRKVVLMTIWLLSPLILYLDPTLFGIFSGTVDPNAFLEHVGLMWLYIGLGGLLFRTVQLFMLKGVQTGLVWFTKIVTDPFHDVLLYYRAPLYVLRGEMMDPMYDVLGRQVGQAEESPG